MSKGRGKARPGESLLGEGGVAVQAEKGAKGSGAGSRQSQFLGGPEAGFRALCDSSAFRSNEGKIQIQSRVGCCADNQTGPELRVQAQSRGKQEACMGLGSPDACS